MPNGISSPIQTMRTYDVYSLDDLNKLQDNVKTHRNVLKGRVDASQIKNAGTITVNGQLKLKLEVEKGKGIFRKNRTKITLMDTEGKCVTSFYHNQGKKFKENFHKAFNEFKEMNAIVVDKTVPEKNANIDRIKSFSGQQMLPPGDLISTPTEHTATKQPETTASNDTTATSTVATQPPTAGVNGAATTGTTTGVDKPKEPLNMNPGMEIVDVQTKLQPCRTHIQRLTVVRAQLSAAQNNFGIEHPDIPMYMTLPNGGIQTELGIAQHTLEHLKSEGKSSTTNIQGLGGSEGNRVFLEGSEKTAQRIQDQFLSPLLTMSVDERQQSLTAVIDTYKHFTNQITGDRTINGSVKSLTLTADQQKAELGKLISILEAAKRELSNEGSEIRQKIETSPGTTLCSIMKFTSNGQDVKELAKEVKNNHDTLKKGEGMEFNRTINDTTFKVSLSKPKKFFGKSGTQVTFQDPQGYSVSFVFDKGKDLEAKIKDALTSVAAKMYTGQFRELETERLFNTPTENFSRQSLDDVKELGSLYADPNSPKIQELGNKLNDILLMLEENIQNANLQAAKDIWYMADAIMDAFKNLDEPLPDVQRVIRDKAANIKENAQTIKNQAKVEQTSSEAAQPETTPVATNGEVSAPAAQAVDMTSTPDTSPAPVNTTATPQESIPTGISPELQKILETPTQDLSVDDVKKLIHPYCDPNSSDAPKLEEKVNDVLDALIEALPQGRTPTDAAHEALAPLYYPNSLKSDAVSAKFEKICSIMEKLPDSGFVYIVKGQKLFRASEQKTAIYRNLKL
ncbi:MAG: hypothetical protein LW808_001745 [Verrucomicrobiota bacterium]|nr:MAG: hypothetical protein LW808_001745 [Verrucomicrobiota bacterium]